MHSLLPSAPEAGRPAGPACPRHGFPWLTLLMAAAAWLAGLLPAADGFLEYERSAVACGQYWRLVTAHWTHWNGAHLFWDVAVFLALGAFCEGCGRKAYLLFIAGGALLVSAAVWFGQPEMERYRGLSGLDAGLYFMTLVVFTKDLARDGSRWALPCFTLLLAAFLAKVGYEVWTGTAVFVKTSGDFVPVPLAHLVGGGAGAAAGLLGRVPGRAGAGAAVKTVPWVSRSCARRIRSASG